MSSPRAIELAKQWKRWGTDVSVETCPHYLLFSDEDTAKWGPYAQVAPPLRSQRSVKALWDLVNEGFVDIIATDHAPGLPRDKEIGKRDIFASGGGLPALETTLPALLDQVNKGRISLELLTSMISENPAMLFGLYPRKGALMPGSDADFNIVDMEKTVTFDIKKMYTKGKDAARIFHGKSVQGAIEKTFIRGNLVAKHGHVVGKPDSGIWIPPVDLHERDRMPEE
jgi:dihydroorotase-like cyclic amidohydrolase